VENEEKGESFDLDKFRKLLQLMEKFDVSEVNLQNEEESWKIRRGPRYAAPTFTQGFAPAPMMQAAPVAAPAAASAPAAAAAPAAPVGITINAPAVGTFYSAASPEDPPFVSVGSVVKPDTVICIIEAMKVFNEIPAEMRGKVVQVLVRNEEAVDFGKPLFKIDTRG
jgi:acetyl-CoA carboxylase biotin carboxyl carrier protein